MRKSPASALFLLAASLFIHPVIAQEVKSGVVIGQFMIKDDGPLSNGQAYFFNDAAGPAPSETKYWRVPDHVVELDSNGTFSIELPAGKYHIGAVKRVTGEQRIGPPGEGDFFLGSQSSQGMPIPTYVVKSGEKNDLGIFPAAAPFKKATVQYGKGITAIEGSVQFADKTPAEGALVFAYLSPNMVGRPTFVSDRVGKDGTFILRVHAGGTYYLKVRDIYGGGPPTAGSIIGSYGQEKPKAVVAKTGEKTSGIKIQVIKFPGRGPRQP